MESANDCTCELSWFEYEESANDSVCAVRKVQYCTLPTVISGTALISAQAIRVQAVIMQDCHDAS